MSGRRSPRWSAIRGWICWSQSVHVMGVTLRSAGADVVAAGDWDLDSAKDAHPDSTVLLREDRER